VTIEEGRPRPDCATCMMCRRVIPRFAPHTEGSRAAFALRRTVHERAALPKTSPASSATASPMRPRSPGGRAASRWVPRSTPEPKFALSNLRGSNPEASAFFPAAPSATRAGQHPARSRCRGAAALPGRPAPRIASTSSPTTRLRPALQILGALASRSRISTSCGASSIASARRNPRGRRTTGTASIWTWSSAP